MKLRPVVILAGGTASRLRPITEKIPKALVDVGGRPFIAHQLRLLWSHGFRSVILAVWYKGEMIRDFVGDGSRFGLHVDYSFDGETPVGTAGAVRNALPMLDGPFFVLYGDSYLPCDYPDIQARFESQPLPGLMTIYRNRGKYDLSNVELSDGRILAYDKQERSARMQYIDYGLGMFQPAVFASLPQGQPADLTQVYQELVAEGRLLPYEVKYRFYEIGSMEGLRELDELLGRDPDQFLRKDAA